MEEKLIKEQEEFTEDKLENLCKNAVELITYSRSVELKEVNLVQLMTYFTLGKWIVEVQQEGESRARYGKRVLKTLSETLNKEFGKSFSVKTLTNMRKFFLIYRDRISEPVVTKLKNDLPFYLSWSHYLILMRIENPEERNFYEKQALKEGWGKRELQRQYESSLYESVLIGEDKEKILKKIPEILSDESEKEKCKICYGALQKKIFKVRLYDKSMKENIAINIKLFYCPRCRIPYCTKYHESLVKNEWPDLILRTGLLVGTSDSKKIRDRRLKRCKKMLYEDPKEILPLEYGTAIYANSLHICKKNEIAIEKFLLVDNEDVEQVVKLRYCKICRKFFMKTDDYQYFESSFSKNYTIIKKIHRNSDNINNKPQIGVLEKGTTIYVGFRHEKNIIGKCCVQSKNITIKKTIMEEYHKDKIMCLVGKCKQCGRLFIHENDYKKWEEKFRSYNFILPKCMIEKEKIENNHDFVINSQDFLTRVNVFQCSYKEHHLTDVVATVKVLRYAGDVVEMKVPAAYCEECALYFILEEDFKKIKRYGHVICKVVENTYWSKKQNHNLFNLNEESLLHLLGYNVNSNASLPERMRWRLLEVIIDEKILSRMEICSHLDYLINRSKNRPSYYQAIAKWQADRKHISEYVIGNKNMEVASVTSNKHKYYGV